MEISVSIEQHKSHTMLSRPFVSAALLFLYMGMVANALNSILKIKVISWSMSSAKCRRLGYSFSLDPVHNIQSNREY